MGKEEGGKEGKGKEETSIANVFKKWVTEKKNKLDEKK